MNLGPLSRLGPSTDRDLAWDRAEAVLRDSLTPEQLATYDEHGHVEVPSRLVPGRVYRVDGWRPVAAFDAEGRFEGAVCLRPRESLPGPDVILAHKLYIEGAERRFLTDGNWLSPAWRPTTAAPTLILTLFLLGPWLLNLLRLGPGGPAAAAVCVAVVAAVAVLRRRTGARSRPVSGPFGPARTG